MKPYEQVEIILSPTAAGLQGRLNAVLSKYADKGRTVLDIKFAVNGEVGLQEHFAMIIYKAYT